MLLEQERLRVGVHEQRRRPRLTNLGEQRRDGIGQLDFATGTGLCALQSLEYCWLRYISGCNC